MSSPGRGAVRSQWTLVGDDPNDRGVSVQPASLVGILSAIGQIVDQQGPSNGNHDCGDNRQARGVRLQ